MPGRQVSSASLAALMETPPEGHEDTTTGVLDARGLRSRTTIVTPPMRWGGWGGGDVAMAGPVALMPAGAARAESLGRLGCCARCPASASALLVRAIWPARSPSGRLGANRPASTGAPAPRTARTPAPTTVKAERKRSARLSSRVNTRTN